MAGSNPVLSALINSCILPHFPEGNERPCSYSDFQEFTDSFLESSRTLLSTLTEPKNLANLSKDLLIGLLTVIGENHAFFPWNNFEIFENVSQIKTAIIQNVGCSVKDMLVKGITSSGGQQIRPLLKPILLSLRPKLLKTCWKEYPAAVQCFIWILKHSKGNNLSDYVRIVLPTALNMVDDFEDENRTAGVICVNRILNEVTLAELKFHGYGQLMYKALEGLLRVREPSLVRVVLPCILRLAIKFETNLEDKCEVPLWSRFDDIYETFLEMMDLEQKIELQSIYIFFLDALIKTGPPVHRWAKRIIHVVDGYLEASRSSCLKRSTIGLLGILGTLVKVPAVRKWHQRDIIFIISRQLYFARKFNPPQKDIEAIIFFLFVELSRDSSKEQLELAFSDLLSNLKGMDVLRCPLLQIKGYLFF